MNWKNRLVLLCFLAAAVVLDGTTVAGPVSISGTTGEVSLETAHLDGPVMLAGNGTSLPSLIAQSTVGGPLACTANNPAPVDNGLPDIIRGPAVGQCAVTFSPFVSITAI